MMGNDIDIKTILEKHLKWVLGEEGGERAKLSGANLSDANLRCANFSYETAFYSMQCPEKGEYTAFKVANGKIVELLIPSDAKRSSATSRKCRASKATVIRITNKDGSDSGLTEIASNYDRTFLYKVGETVEIKNFDSDRWNECSNGIHHFITREEAVMYDG